MYPPTTMTGSLDRESVDLARRRFLAGPTPPSTGRRILYRDGALADGRSERLTVGVSILVEDGVVRWIRPSDDEGPLGSRSSL